MRQPHRPAGRSTARRRVTGGAAVALLLLLAVAAAPRRAAAQDVKAALTLDRAVAENQYAWSILPDRPTPLSLKLPAGQTAQVTYTTKYQRRLLSTKFTVAGFVNFTNRGNLPLIVSGGQVTICNGFFAELNATTKGAPINAGCSGSSYSIPLRRSLNPPKSAPGGQAVVPFEGTVTVNRITAPTINGNGINGPVATAYVDAYLTTGGRVVSTPQRFSFDISPGQENNRGETAIAYDDFVTGPIAPLTIFPVATSGNKIPDGLGLKIEDTNSYTYTASFKYVDGQTPCNVPLTAANTQRLYVQDPGDAPLPEPATTAVTITFTDCKSKSGGRFGFITPTARLNVSWGLKKTANVTSLRVRRGDYAAVRYRVEATRPPPKAAYSLSGAVFVSPKDGVLGGKPLDVQSVTVSGAGGSVKAACQLAGPDNHQACPFAGLKYATPGLAPVAGELRAEIVLKDGSRIQVPPERFDFTKLAPNFVIGRKAEITDTFSGPNLDAANAAGLAVDWDRDLKPPGGTDGVALTIEDARTFDYAVRLGGPAAKCGRYRLTNTARLAPINATQAPITAAADVSVEVYGC